MDRVRQGHRHVERPDGEVGQHPRHDDEGQEHRAEEVREVVPGVDRRHAEPDGGEHAPPPVPGGADGLGPPPPPARQAPRQADHATRAVSRRGVGPPVSGGPARPARSRG